jgi:hypothetical protein
MRTRPIGQARVSHSSLRMLELLMHWPPLARTRRFRRESLISTARAKGLQLPRHQHIKSTLPLHTPAGRDSSAALALSRSPLGKARREPARREPAHPVFPPILYHMIAEAMVRAHPTYREGQETIYSGAPCTTLEIKPNTARERFVPSLIRRADVEKELSLKEIGEEFWSKAAGWTTERGGVSVP